MYWPTCLEILIFVLLTSFSTASIIPLINKTVSSRDLTIFMIPSTFSFKNTSVVCKPYIFFWITAYVADVAAVNPNGTKTLLLNGVSAFFIKGKWVVINGLRKLQKHPSWLLIFLVVLFNKIPIFSNDLITFIISLISLFLSVSPGPHNLKILFLVFLTIILSPLLFSSF